MKRKILVCLVCIAVIFPPNVFIAAALSATVTVGQVSAAPGESVVVSVMLDNNPGIANFIVRVSYDGTRLGIGSGESIAHGNALDRLLFLAPEEYRYRQNPFHVAWFGLGTVNDTASGVLLNIEFTVLPDAPEGNAFVTAEAYYARHWNENIQDFEPVLVETSAGGVLVLGSGNVQPTPSPSPSPSPSPEPSPSPSPEPSPSPSPTPPSSSPAPTSPPSPSPSPTPTPGDLTPVPIAGEKIIIDSDTLLNLIEQGGRFEVEKNGVTAIISGDALADFSGAENITIGLTLIDTNETVSSENFLTVEISITADGEEIGETAVPFIVSLSLEDFDLEDINTYRIAAISETGVIGGIADSQTKLFTFRTRYTGRFSIDYVEDLNRLSLQIGFPVISDLAANATTQIMDALPVIQNGRTLVPVRFVADALGAETGWTPATDTEPLIVHLAIDGKTLSFAIGEITPYLAALGMDVPALIMDGRTMVPLRFVSEFFGAIVNWDDETRGIEIIRLTVTP